ncbi:hypothetical protein NM688_g4851 [Phlebia brevispora]|uniref:Uncharacterized protein n=1 Tax=Phlebia brevispora TaxID=194682 RepID=A0ACC1T1X4_9APHY|nr:hypothetical protein NM688_g4851 [Phlebia brevispora]
MSNTTTTLLKTDGLNALSAVMSLTFQSLFYGIYCMVITACAYVLLKKRPQSRSNLLMLGGIFVPFVLSTSYWAIQIAEVDVLIETCFVHRDRRNEVTLDDYATIPNAIVLINYIISDAVVVQRAWLLCKAEYAKVVYLTMTFLTFTGLTVFATIGIRIALIIIPSNHNPLRVAINFMQESTLLFSLVTNFTATGVISHMAWRHRRLIKEGLSRLKTRATRTQRVLALLIESGLVYCIFGALVVVFSLVRLPFGTVGDIYTPVQVQIAGIYPTLIVVLVALEQTFNKTASIKFTTIRVDDIRSNREPELAADV